MAAATLVVAAAACGGPAPAPREAPFPGSRPSLDLLGRGVLAALTRGDTAALEDVRLTEAEHNEVVWPELPAARPEVGFPVDLAWRNVESRNRKDVARLLAAYRGRVLDFRAVACPGGVETFETFVVHTGCRVRFRAREDDRIYEALLFEDAIERSGGFKLFRYDDDGARPRLATGAGT